MFTKKMLVAFDPKKPDAQSSDFLVPQWGQNDLPFLFGLKSGKEIACGMVIFTGRDISPNDVFAKLVDSGRQIPDIGTALAQIDSYLGMIKKCKVGDVVMLRFTEQSPNYCFEKIKKE